MTPDQAVTYKDNVRKEYNRIVEENDAIMASEVLVYLHIEYLC